MAEDEMVRPHYRLDGHEFDSGVKFWELVKDREA